MPSSFLETIMEEVKSLTPDERRVLLEGLKQEQRTELVRSVRGRYENLAVTTEDVLQNKAEEIELEERLGHP
jgi:ribosome recycling factor